MTTERIKVDTGALRKRSESMELFRVKDIAVKRSIKQPARGRGDVTITSTDLSTPKLTIESVARADEVAEALRALVREARIRSGVVTQERM